MAAAAPHVISRIILGWLALITILIVYSGSGASPFFRIGPHEDLVVFGVEINSLYRYFAIVNYMIVSAGMRALEMQVITPWVLQNVQTADAKSAYALRYGQEIIFIQNLYKWIDWLAYTIVLLTQIDLFVIEMTADLVISYFITANYLATETDLRTSHVRNNDEEAALTPL